jgi:GcrA cell cycle regulator
MSRSSVGYENPWTTEVAVELAILWKDGRSASQIALVLHQKFTTAFSRNAIVGKLRRLNLRREGFRALPRAPKIPVTPKPRVVVAAPPPAPKEPGPTLMVLEGLPSRQRCKWPIGTPGDADFHSCEAFAILDLDGKPRPYCAPHCQVAYVPRKASSVPLEKTLRRYV